MVYKSEIMFLKDTTNNDDHFFTLDKFYGKLNLTPFSSIQQSPYLYTK